MPFLETPNSFTNENTEVQRKKKDLLNYPAKLFCQLGNQKHHLNPGLSGLKIHSLHFQWLPGQVTLRNTNNKHKAEYFLHML